MLVIRVIGTVPYIRDKIISFLPERSGAPDSAHPKSGFKLHVLSDQGRSLVTGPSPYPATAVMVSELALMISDRQHAGELTGGVATAASLFGDEAIQRLSQHGLKFHNP
jgi:short subunit dehydrogenase-like uncharacterized protein